MNTFSIFTVKICLSNINCFCSFRAWLNLFQQVVHSRELCNLLLARGEGCVDGIRRGRDGSHLVRKGAHSVFHALKIRFHLHRKYKCIQAVH